MRPENDGIVYRSRTYPFVLGQTIPIDINFLSPALSFAAPEISDIRFVLTGSVTAGAGGSALGRDGAKLFDNIQIKAAQEIVNVSGAALRVNEQHEFGAKQTDPADIIASATNAAYEQFLVIPYEFQRAPDEYERDARLSLLGLMATGLAINIRCAAALPTNYAAVTLNVQVYVTVKESRQKQVNALYCLQEYSLTTVEDQIPVEGSLRMLIMTSKLTTTGYTSLATLIALDSKTLMYESGLEPRILRDRYRREHFAVGTNDENLLAAPGAVPWVFADKGQKIGAMVMASKCHIKLNLGAVPASSVFLVGSFQDRAPRYSANSAGYNDVGQYVDDLMAHGIVRDKKNTPVTQFDPKLVNKLPLRIPAG